MTTIDGSDGRRTRCVTGESPPRPRRRHKRAGHERPYAKVDSGPKYSAEQRLRAITTQPRRGRLSRGGGEVIVDRIGMEAQELRRTPAAVPGSVKCPATQCATPIEIDHGAQRIIRRDVRRQIANPDALHRVGGGLGPTPLDHATKLARVPWPRIRQEPLQRLRFHHDRPAPPELFTRPIEEMVRKSSDVHE